MKTYSIINSKSEPGKVMVSLEEVILNSFGMPKASRIGYTTRFVPVLTPEEMLNKLNSGEVQYEFDGHPNTQGVYRLRQLEAAETE